MPGVDVRPAAHGACIALLLVSAGCASAPFEDDALRVDTLPGGTIAVRNGSLGAWGGPPRHLTEDLRIGPSGHGPSSFAAIGAIAVDRQGRVYVLETAAREVRVFDSCGHFVRSLANVSANGPRFEDPSGIAADPSGNLWVVDPGTRRYVVFDSAGGYRRSVGRPYRYNRFPWPGGFDDHGRLIDNSARVGGRLREEFVIRLDTQAVPIDSLRIALRAEKYFQHRTGRSFNIAAVPFTSRTIWRADSRGYVWTGDTGDYRIYQRGPSGDTVRIVERRYERVAVRASERDSAVARLAWFTARGGKVKPSRIPLQRPAFERILGTDDAGRLWVQPGARSSQSGRLLDAFDSGGVFTGQLISSVRLVDTALPVFRGERIYFVAGDSNAMFVVRARLPSVSQDSVPAQRAGAAGTACGDEGS